MHNVVCLYTDVNVNRSIKQNGFSPQCQPWASVELRYFTSACETQGQEEEAVHRKAHGVGKDFEEQRLKIAAVINTSVFRSSVAICWSNDSTLAGSYVSQL